VPLFSRLSPLLGLILLLPVVAELAPPPVLDITPKLLYARERLANVHTVSQESAAFAAAVGVSRLIFSWRKSGLQLSPRWRKTDSNLWFPDRPAAVFKTAVPSPMTV
jgi:hypothetical protein